GAEVRGYDPAVPGSSPDVPAAVDGADAVLSVNAATVAVDAATDALPALGADAVYADLNTGTPSLKRELAALVGSRFADVALIGPVPLRGLRTPTLASSPPPPPFP